MLGGTKRRVQGPRLAAEELLPPVGTRSQQQEERFSESGEKRVVWTGVPVGE